MHSRGGMTIDPSYNAGKEHVGFSLTRQTSRAPSAKGGRWGKRGGAGGRGEEKEKGKLGGG